MSITILDGPLGTALSDLGVPTPAPLWSAAALTTHPGVIADIHRAHVRAGATVHTANTFRTTRRAAGADWRRLTQSAVDLTRSVLPPSHRLAGSIAPLEDCYSPERSPSDPGPEHALLAEALVAAGCDLLLCETFPHIAEGLAAVEVAVQAASATGAEVWVSFTAGYRADLLTPDEIARGARFAVERGADAVLVNCIPARDTLRYVERLADLGVPFGAYANAGHPTDGLGWASTDQGPTRYADIAQTWVDAGATLIGSCCGTSAATTAELARRFNPLEKT
ncbi:MAG: S-methylmethionine-dependent homocysteine/selenocysteine methylase [Myxococcota bacterium]|jgi:S-methylmethionine-dependent homocysteine/selenocysteine methylase